MQIVICRELRAFCAIFFGPICDRAIFYAFPISVIKVTESGKIIELVSSLTRITPLKSLPVA